MKKRTNIIKINLKLQESLLEHQKTFDPENPRDFIDIYLKEIYDKKDDQNTTFTGQSQLNYMTFANMNY